MRWQSLLFVALFALCCATITDLGARVALVGIAIVFCAAAAYDKMYRRPSKKQRKPSHQ